MMYKIDTLTLLSGIDIPIPELKVNIHQPTIREIAYIGERSFYQASSLLTLSKEDLALRDNMSDEDKAYLLSQSNFQVLMSIVHQGDGQIQKVNLLVLLTLLFPKFKIDLEERFIMLTPIEGQGMAIIDENNFEILQSITKVILCLGRGGDGQDEFNPAGDKAKAIADKIKQGRAKIAAQKEQKEEEVSILSRYISGLSIGTNSLDIKKLLDLTLYQLFDQLERYGLFTANDLGIKAKMAGAKDVEDVDWLKNIH